MGYSIGNEAVRTGQTSIVKILDRARGPGRFIGCGPHCCPTLGIPDVEQSDRASVRIVELICVRMTKNIRVTGIWDYFDG